MLKDKSPIATVAVRDMAVADAFYGGTLGLTRLPGPQTEAVSYEAGSGTLLVYRSTYAGTNRATAVTWPAGTELDDIVRALKAKGVAFERYEMPNMRLEGDVHVADGMRVAWFKDPDGNIHSLVIA